jgi:hypothetical protein
LGKEEEKDIVRIGKHISIFSASTHPLGLRSLCLYPVLELFSFRFAWSHRHCREGY